MIIFDKFEDYVSKCLGTSAIYENEWRIQFIMLCYYLFYFIEQ